MESSNQSLDAGLDQLKLLLGPASIAAVVVHGGQILFANEPAAEALGASSPDHLRGQPVKVLFGASPIVGARADLERAIAEARAIGHQQGQLLRLDGASFPVQFNAWPVPYGRSQAMVVTFTRATEKAQTETHQDDAHLRLVMNRMPLLVSYIDRDLRYQFVNQRYLDWFGQSEEYFRTHTLPEVVGPEAFGRLEDKIRTALNGEPATFDLELRYKSAGLRHLHVNYVPDRASDGTTRGVVVIAEDVGTQKATARALQQSEERYRAFIEQSSEGIWRCELDPPIDVSLPLDEQIDQAYARGFLAECNDAMARMYGLQHASDLLGARLPDLLPRSDPHNEAYLKAFINGGYRITNAESHEIDARGSQRYFLNNMVGIVEDGRLVRSWGTQQDITEQKHIAKALVAREEELRTVLANTPEIISRFDRKGRFLYTSPAVTRSTGLPTSAFLGKTHGELPLPPETAEMLHQTLREIFRSGESREVEFSLPSPQGDVRHYHGVGVPEFNSAGEVETVLTIVRDTTEQRAAEEALRASEERYRFLAEAMPPFVWTRDDTGRLDFVNKAFQDYTKKNLDELRELDWYPFVHPDDVAIVAEKALLRDAGIAYEMEYRLRRHDGLYFWFLGRGLPYVLPDGRRRWLATAIDIEARRRMEDDLRHTNAALEQYAYAASHDLQEPLRMVVLYTQLLRRKHSSVLNEEALGYFRVIEEAALRMSALVRDLLSYSQLLASSEDSFTAVDANEAVASTLTDLRAMIESAKATVVVGRLPIVSGDLPAIMRVFHNFLSNAIKYAKPDVSPRIEISAEREGSLWKFSVSDNGIGIDPQYHDRIWGLFKRLHNAEVPGTGIGLAICKRTVEHHGGSVSIVSNGKDGSTFCFTLPEPVPPESFTAPRL